MPGIRNYIKHFIKGNILFIAGTLFAVICSNLLSILLSLSVGLFYDLHFHAGSSKGIAIKVLFPGIHDLQGFAILFCALVLLKVIFTFWGKSGTGIIGERLTKELREMLFEKQMQQSLASFQRKAPGKYLLRYSGDLTVIQQFVNKGALAFSGDIVLLMATMVVLFLMQFHLGLAVLSIWLAGGVLTYFSSRVISQYAVSRRNQRSDMLSFVSERFQHFLTIKAFNRERPETARFKKFSAKMYQLGKKYQYANAVIQSIFPLFFQGAIGVVLWMIADGESIHRSNTLVFVLLIFYMQGAFRRVFQVNMTWQNGMISFRKLFETLEMPAEERPLDGIERIAARKISFEDVHFSFQEDNMLLHDLSCEIPPEGITLITNGSAQEKSVVLRLMLKLYIPDSGEIFLDQAPYSSLTPFEIRKHITIVSSDFPVMGRNVFQAITYQPDEEKKEKALEWLRKLEFRIDLTNDQLLDLPLKHQTTHFSKGEHIILQFVRAFLTNKKILLLDDPFHVLDQKSQQILVKILNQLSLKRTIILASDNVPEGLNINHTLYL